MAIAMRMDVGDAFPASLGVAMAEAVVEFVKTDLARRLGFLYKVDVITVATRELLEKYSFYSRPEEVVKEEEEKQ